jgi:hypothetical protein
MVAYFITTAAGRTTIPTERRRGTGNIAVLTVKPIHTTYISIILNIP